MKKLVRDKIPHIAKIEDKKCFQFYVAGEAEYKEALRAKLQEEVTEFLQDNNGEELADILEVIHTLACYEFGGFDKIEKIRQKKVVERGGFNERIIMENIQ